MTSVRIVAMLLALTVRLWVNSLQRSLKSTWLARCVVMLPVLLLAGWLIGGTISFGGQVSVTPELADGLSQPLSSALFALSAVASLFVAVYSTGKTIVDGLLVVVPLPRFARYSLDRAIAVLLGAVIGFAWSFPLAFQFFVVADSLATGALLLVSAATISLLGSVACQLVLVAVESTLGVSGMFRGRNDPVLRAISATAAAILVAWQYVLAQPFTLAREPGGLLLLFAGVLDPEAPPLRIVASAVVVLAACALGTVLISATDHLPVGSPGRRRLRSARSIDGRKIRAVSAIGLEVRQWLRFPFNLALLLFVFLIFFALAIFWREAESDQWNIVAYALLAVLATAGVGSYGPTRAHHWIFEVSGNPHGWVLPKIVSVLAVGGCAVIVMAVLMLGLTTWDGGDLDLMLPILFVEMTAGALIGLLLPVGREQSFGNAASEFTAIFFAVAVAFLAQSLPGTSVVKIAMQLTLGGGIVILYILVARQLRHKL